MTSNDKPGMAAQVLVADDDVVSRMMLMHLVDSCGPFTIHEAEDGADAWRQLAAGLRPAIVFCDLRMPHLSGTELLARVKADPELAAIPFVLVSAANDGASMGEAAALGADGYVVKPFKVEQLRPHLAALLPDDEPQACARRLGIDLARLRLYFGGLARQLDEAMAERATLAATPDLARTRLARLGEGCATLGLHRAAAGLARAGQALAPAVLAEALEGARAAVARGVERLEST